MTVLIKTNYLQTHQLHQTKKVEPIEVSTPNCPDHITGNRIIDMEILSSIVNMLACPSCKAVNMKVSEMYSRKKGLASFLFFFNATVAIILLNRILHGQLIIALI